MKLFERKKRASLTRIFTREGIEFSFTGERPPVFPINANPPEILSDLLPQGVLWAELDNLWTDDLLHKKDENTWIVPYDVYNRVDHEEDHQVFDTLGIPVPMALKLETRSRSNVGDINFRISVEATHPDHGPLREGDPQRDGGVFFVSKDTIIPLAKSQADLFDVAKGESVDWSKLEDRMSYLAATKRAAKEAGAIIDSYMASEDYEFKTEAAIDLTEKAPDEIQLIPKIDGLEDQISSANLLGEETRRVITQTKSPTKRKRFILGSNLRAQLSKLPKGGRVTGTDVPKLLTNPESIIPEGFDLSLFSERVKGIRTKVYNSRPYIHINRNKGGWFEGIPGVELEDWSPIGDDDGKTGHPETDFGTKNLSEETYRELVKRAKESRSEYVLHEGKWIHIDPGIAERYERTLEELKGEDGAIKIPPGSILDIYENLELLEFIDRKSFRLDEDRLIDDLPKIDPPTSFNGELYPYQVDGYRWLSRLSDKMAGGLLADEMGLGKTIQVISHMLKLKEEDSKGPHLVVMPKTLMENWSREINQFAKSELTCFHYDGSNRRFNEKIFNQFDVVITTYDVLRIDQTKLAQVDWNMLVCDEAQYAKNPTTQRTCAVKALKSRHRAALTGTPVENGLIEFWCIMDFVQPGLLGSWADFRTNFERPILQGGDEQRTEKIENLLSKIKGHYLRRMKEETLALPPKKIQYIETQLSDGQFEIYRNIARQAKAGGKGAMLAAIGKLIRLCAHPSAVIEEKYDSALEKIKCPKLDATLDIIDKIKSRSEKAIIFTDFKKIQRVLQECIRERFGVWADVINGEITSNRQHIIDIFSEKPGFNLIILGHQVGGVGLNIAAANNVIHYTRPWNPAKENQATDRVHRIGQGKEVNVYYPIVKDERFITVEQRMAELIQSKSELARDVLRPSAEFKLKPEDLIDCIDDSKLLDAFVLRP